MNITLDAEKIRKAAETSPEAAKALKILAPAAFEAQPVELKDDGAYRQFNEATRKLGLEDLQIRACGNLAGKSFYLGSEFKWTIEKDEDCQNVLVARERR
jgi:hypothetical protein